MTLLIQVGDRTLTFDESRLLRIGRAADSDVVLAAMSVSRTHAELRPTPEGWRLVDAGGQFGTYVGGQRVTELVLAGVTTIQCGPEAPDSSLVVTVQADTVQADTAQADAAPIRMPPPPPVVPPAIPPAPATPPASPVPTGGPTPEPVLPGFEPTYILAGPLTGPHPGVVQPRTGPDLMVEVEGREHRFRHPETVTIGRLPESSIVVTDPVASRAHLRVDPVPGGWGFTNLSREGTFVADGRRVESETFDSPITLRLGHPTAGPEVVLVPVLSSQEEQARLAGRRRARLLTRVGALLGALAVVVVLVVGSVVVLGGGGNGNGATPVDTMAQLTDQEADDAKAKTVLISFHFVSGQDEYISTGSGSIISPDGLILTNAHVAAPESPGLEQYSQGAVKETDPPYLTVQVTNPADDFATDGKVYRAHVLEADGHVDVAVIQIYADGDGNALDPATLDLPSYTLGDSDNLDTSDQVTLLGFPAIARAGEGDPLTDHPSVTVTRGIVSTFIAGAYGPRSEIDTDARLSQGNSGGSAIDNDGRLIGIPSATFTESGAQGYSGRVRPIDAVKDIIAKAEAEAK